MEFSAADSLGSLPPDRIAKYLEEIGDVARANALVESAVQGQNIVRPGAPFNATGLQIGFIASNDAEGVKPIIGAAQISPAPELIGTQIKISFNRAFVYEYPGLGAHSILCEFVGRNQIDGEKEALRMALRFKSRDGTLASVVGVPIFLGLTVGENGIEFEGRTVNVGSSTDEALLGALDSEAFKNGLALVNNLQPGLKPFVSLMQCAVKGVANRLRNVQVHHFNLGLDFSADSIAARLNLGSYVIVQTNETQWNWNDFEWDMGSMSVRAKNPSRKIDFNYLVIGISPYTPTPATPAARRRISAG
ncbi:hypothetical protein [Acidovorax sp.]|uniref:hypothetical protein n=1 Tax=Acidovorax sp. TaxID=1872122 RepID=UPI003CFEB996